MQFVADLDDEHATERAGAALASALAERAGGVVYLEGELGAGKTTLARGFLRALGVSGPVRSPTYTLMEPYEADARFVVHMDLYRLRDAAELWELGLDSYPPERTLWLVEWPERGGSLLPAPLLRLRLDHAGPRRRLFAAGEPDLVARLRPEAQSEH